MEVTHQKEKQSLGRSHLISWQKHSDSQTVYLLERVLKISWAL
jgi:hypothetical protein